MACLFLPALATDAGESAQQKLRKKDYAGAVPLLRASVEREPRSSRLHRDLGIALYKSGDATGAVPPLRTARQLGSGDRSTLYFLGAAAEASQDSALALEAYRSCLATGGRGLEGVRARVESLVRAELQRSLARAIADEQRLTVDTIPVNTIAVPEFALAGGPDSLRPICRGLAYVLLTDLQKVPQLRIVERERLPVLLQELALAKPGAASAVDPATAPRYGRLIGARRFAQGAMLASNGPNLELRGAVIDARAGELRTTGPPVEGALREVLVLEKRLVFKILDTLGIEVTPSLRKSIGVPPTKSYDAFVAYSRGLDFEARGLQAEAAQAYGAALRLDPGFALARDRNDVVTVNPTSTAAMEQTLLAETTNPSGGEGRQQQSTDAMGFGPSIGQSPAQTRTLDQPSRLELSGLTPLPQFPRPQR